jgi:hypothetical protein
MWARPRTCDLRTEPPNRFRVRINAEPMGRLGEAGLDHIEVRPIQPGSFFALRRKPAAPHGFSRRGSSWSTGTQGRSNRDGSAADPELAARPGVATAAPDRRHCPVRQVSRNCERNLFRYSGRVFARRTLRSWPTGHRGARSTES